MDAIMKFSFTILGPSNFDIYIRTICFSASLWTWIRGGEYHGTLCHLSSYHFSPAGARPGS